MVFYNSWLLFSLCAPKICPYENSDEKIGNLEEGNLSIKHSQVEHYKKVAILSQRIFTLIQNYYFSIHQINLRKSQELLFSSEDTLSEWMT